MSEPIVDGWHSGILVFRFPCVYVILSAKQGRAGRASGPGTETNVQFDRQRNIANQVYAYLRDQIVMVELDPGAPINERALVEQFGVSRTPIREAVRRLSSEGLIEIHPNVGTFVASLSLTRLKEGHLIRSSLEGAAIRIAATRFDAEADARLEDLLTRHRKAHEQGTSREVIAADDAFHRVIVETSGFPNIWTIICQARAELDRLRHMTTNVPGRSPDAIREHSETLQALRTGDPDACQRMLQRHLDLAFAVVMDVFKERPETPEHVGDSAVALRH